MQRRPRGERSEGVAREFAQHIEHGEGFPVRARVWVLGGFILLLFGILTVQLVRLQLLNHDEYVARAASNRVRTIDIPPARGLIYDRDGNLLVENAPAYRIMLISADVPDHLVTQIAEELAEMFDRQAWEIEEQIWDRKYSNDPFLPLLIAEEPNPAQVIDVTSRRSLLPGVQVETISSRRYEHGRLLGHILGYVGAITEEEYEDLSGARYLYSDQIGRTGVEAAYERQLRGTAGRELVEVDAVGNVLWTLNSRSSQPGLSIVLTIDIELQQRIEDILLEHQGASLFAAAVVLDVRNGEVLAMVSVPNYDVNIYEEVTTDEYQELLEDPGQPLINHAIQDQFPPGSIFKIVTAVAGLAEGAITPDTRIYSPGVLEVHNELSPGIIYRFGDTTQGVFNIRTALAESSNVFFYYVAGGDPYRNPDNPPRHPSEQERLDDLADDGIVAGDVQFVGAGNEALARWAREMGFDAPTGVDLVGEAAGLITSAQQKLEAFGEEWRDGDTYNMAIGQGFITVTPLQMAVATAAIANGGTVLEPRVVRELIDTNGKVVQPWQPSVRNQIDVDPEILRIVREGMALCTLMGTCHDALVELPEMLIGGKTGTAEFNQTGTAVSGAEEGPTHGWFIAFAPFDDPEIAIAVFFEFSAGYLASAAGGEILRAWAETSGALSTAIPPPHARIAITDEENERLEQAVRERSR
ncbi:MAG: penicillin-binding protein 2 [Chloroflexi bacterium]|nr:penicillin-binding protein 2 [Chloroflexota bacterium]MCY3684720.1 penicillin-binding protein 2 [Chloroflexota bacterium]MDE2707276.1 penicillin-binding protein 2 [Chloroflexota bacterium]